jgi:hypothetical protein
VSIDARAQIINLKVGPVCKATCGTQTPAGEGVKVYHTEIEFGPRCRFVLCNR